MLYQLEVALIQERHVIIFADWLLAGEYGFGEILIGSTIA
jgi:hypothetical protein